MPDIAALRRFYARLVTARGEVGDARIVEAFATIEREQFLGPPPWHVKAGGSYVSTETTDPAVVYQDILIALAPERGINNGEPSLHAKCIGMARPSPGDIVIHVGAGTGYYTAILAFLAEPEGQVHAYEIEKDLAQRAERNLAHIGAVTVHARSALDGWLPPADVIYVSAGATHVPHAWLDALKRGGRLVMPLTPNEGIGCMLLVTKRDNDTAYAAQIFSTAAFIPCIGARDDRQSRALAVALDTRNPEDVRSLKRGVPPDDTVWCDGGSWWLSTADPEWNS